MEERSADCPAFYDIEWSLRSHHLPVPASPCGWRRPPCRIPAACPARLPPNSRRNRRTPRSDTPTPLPFPACPASLFPPRPARNTSAIRISCWFPFPILLNIPARSPNRSVSYAPRSSCRCAPEARAYGRSRRSSDRRPPARTAAPWRCAGRFRPACRSPRR